MFDEYTEEYFMEHAVEMGQKLAVDTRQGSVYMDAAAGHCLRAAKFMSDLRSAFEMLAIDTCTGNILTEKAAMDGVNRQLSTSSYWNVSFEGTVPDTGDRFYVGTYYFTLEYIDEKYYLKSEINGTETNYLTEGENVIPVYNVNGLTSCTLGSLDVPGTDDEDDNSLRERWKEKKSGPSENGNRSQIKTWCESITGVGRAHILSLYGGENTIKGVIYSTEGGIPSTTILEAVQTYIDPIVAGYSVVVNGKTLVFGDGLGDGAAQIGAHFLASAPDSVEISVSFSADLKNGYTKDQVKANVLQSIREYAKKLVLEGDETIVIRVSSIGSIIADTEGVLDYSPSSLMLNGAGSNIDIGKEQAPVIKEVVVND
ncbi:MAG: baseplate J/gp47 family protein [Hespellia sp.]|nr:baseplate J/gp47 family protein [Hespellia sp.]